MSYNRTISSDDPQAVEKLTSKLEACQKRQEFMKSVNSFYRKNGTAHGCPGVSEETAKRMDEAVRTGYSWVTAPFPSYELSNNNAEIRRLKQRIEQLSASQELGYVGWTFGGGEAVANTDNNRLQLIFDEKPTEEQRIALKRNGFHWSPSEQAWQRQLNDNAIYAASRLDFVRPENGESPVQLQPKAKPSQQQER
ncbi:DUF3560 domain-containing protein [Acutalibacter muris]|uniref:DUF3560 domain-containing protein n=1 Tax=Acutalibacter muris TaxID=1796620 RepID=UPI001C3EDBA1|nr:DUF3560 domain-containing protein [Acutalibacter muris]